MPPPAPNPFKRPSRENAVAGQKRTAFPLGFFPLGDSDPLKNTLFPRDPADPEAPPKVPEASDEAVQAARDKERKKRKNKKGRRSTILTSQLGDTTDPTLEKKSLLGG